MSLDNNVQKTIHCYWTIYKCAKSMGVHETLCENVGSVSNELYDDQKNRTLPKKVKKKTILKVHYNKDKKKSDTFISKASDIYEKNIGSHVLKDQSSKLKHKVIKKINKQQKNSVFSLPVIFD